MMIPPKSNNVVVKNRRTLVVNPLLEVYGLDSLVFNESLLNEQKIETVGTETGSKKEGLQNLQTLKEKNNFKKETKGSQKLEPESSYKERVLPSNLVDLKLSVEKCIDCGLCEDRLQTVFGEGSLNPKLMFIGEGPGETEDSLGRPFVGSAGELLDKMIVAMGFKREDVYVANIVKCRPPENRKPFKSEMQKCIPYLEKQIEILKPSYIICLGTVAVSGLLGSNLGITKLRGRFLDYKNIKVMPTYHPAYLLRYPKAKRDAWGDLQMVMEDIKS